ncbi:hypothetical protein N658DRAFT_283990 [Parathielavia hyrcaniae]|uniref:Uncharacterized protein n=1 Tax=Parathielavia hyrcaniae TaxID=113614 RepID=A0AAN6T3Q2_9PEZI|nr:hypothetical protein N658DRAFT_283990 [Parathielavia hyrcaniae]
MQEAPLRDADRLTSVLVQTAKFGCACAFWSSSLGHSGIAVCISNGSTPPFFTIYHLLGHRRFLDENHPTHQSTTGTTSMHFGTMVHHATARVRPRSMQFENRPVSPETRTRRVASQYPAATRDAPARLTPGARTSSLPLTISQQPPDVLRSMLDVGHAPRIPLAHPLSYGELYPGNPKPVADAKAPLSVAPDRQNPRLPSPGALALLVGYR